MDDSPVPADSINADVVLSAPSTMTDAPVPGGDSYGADRPSLQSISLSYNSDKSEDNLLPDGAHDASVLTNVDTSVTLTSHATPTPTLDDDLPLWGEFRPKGPPKTFTGIRKAPPKSSPLPPNPPPPNPPPPNPPSQNPRSQNQPQQKPPQSVRNS